MTAVTDEPPRFAHHGVFGPELRTRRLSPQQMIGMAAVLSGLLAVLVGVGQYQRADHGSAVEVMATAIGPVDLKQTEGGVNSICHATMRVTSPRSVTQRIDVPCGVTTGNPTGAFLYADDTLSMLDPPPTWQLIITAVGVAMVVGSSSFFALTVVILLGLRLRHWLEDR